MHSIECRIDVKGLRWPRHWLQGHRVVNGEVLFGRGYVERWNVEVEGAPVRPAGGRSELRPIARVTCPGCRVRGLAQAATRSRCDVRRPAPRQYWRSEPGRRGAADTLDLAERSLPCQPRRRRASRCWSLRRR